MAKKFKPINAIYIMGGVIVLMISQGTMSSFSFSDPIGFFESLAGVEKVIFWLVLSALAFMGFVGYFTKKQR